MLHRARLIAFLLPFAAMGALAIARSAVAAPAPAAHQAGQVGGYIDPFMNPAWSPARTDMGVDWIPSRPTPVVAIGDAVILGSDSHSGWPGHHFLWYQLTDGSHAGDIVYVAEALKDLLPAGRRVKAGWRIATALPKFPYTEWGWADQYGDPRAGPCYHEGRQTNSGKEMARFLLWLGAPVAEQPGLGPDRPSGKLC